MIEILPGLYLGDANDSRDLQSIHDNSIACIINATKLDVGFHPDLPKDISRIRIPIDDDGNRDHDFDLFIALPYAVYRIDMHLFMGQGVLTHCAAGRQRSASILAAYAIWKYGVSVEEAVILLQNKKREAFFPEANFIRTLHMWHARCHGLPVPDMSSLQKPSTYLIN